MNTTRGGQGMNEKQAIRQAAKELGIQVVTRANKGKLNRRAKEIITELAHWVKIYSDQRRVENPALLKLLQRAREATK
jgi:hypothetical protein